MLRQRLPRASARVDATPSGARYYAAAAMPPDSHAAAATMLPLYICRYELDIFATLRVAAFSLRAMPFIADYALFFAAIAADADAASMLFSYATMLTISSVDFDVCAPRRRAPLTYLPCAAELLRCRFTRRAPRQMLSAAIAASAASHEAAMMIAIALLLAPLQDYAAA